MSHGAYYNENDPYASQWLKNLITEGLIANGDVDDRDIRDVQPGDLAGYRQVHLFAGIGGWSRALRLAGWADDGPEVWTGSCPCQPFSSAGKRLGTADPRHLWPEFRRLVSVCRPPVVFGEQVAAAKVWLDAVLVDLEAFHYACGAAILPAAGVGAPHKRDRLWFVADASGERGRIQSGRRRGPNGTHPPVTEHDGARGPAPKPNGQSKHAGAIHAEVAGASQLVADTKGQRRKPRSGTSEAIWTGRETVEHQGCTQGSRRDFWAIEPGMGRVAHGIPARVAKLRALGNSIVPQVAAEFITAAREAVEENRR